MEFETVLLKNILEINPKTVLKQGTLAKKVAMENIKENLKYIKNYNLETFKSGSKFKNGDTLVARITPCLENGKTAYVDILEDDEVAFGSTEFFVIRPKQHKADSQFLYYLMRTPYIREILIKSMTGTSGRQRAQKDSLLDLQIDLPKYECQVVIGKLLSNLDDKIRLNSQLTANLEELSQALFKRWFVDFEFPDENGLPYTSSNKSLEDLPPLWEKGSIDNIGTIIAGGTPSKKIPEYFTDKGISWLTPKDLSNNKNKFIYKGENDITELGLQKSSAKLMPKNTVLFSSRAPIGYIALAGKEMTTNQGFKSIIPNKGYNSYFIYFLLKNKLSSIEKAAGGSTFKEISGKSLKQIEILIPPKHLVCEFEEIVSPYFEKIKSLELENNSLIELRDTLLPKLMSGEIELPDTLEVTEDAELLQRG